MPVRRDIYLKNLTNFNIGGRADYFYEVKNIEDIKKALRLARENNISFFILGGGTNLLVSDGGFHGVVIKQKFDFIERIDDTVRVGAGVLMRDLVGFCLMEGLSGLEWAGGLPGTVGGAIRGNAGAFGGEIKDSILEVKSFDTITGEEIIRKNSECGFSYRSSIFKLSGGREIILEATFGFKKGDVDSISKSIMNKIAFRTSHHPLNYPNAGSIFKNVDVRFVAAEVLAHANAVIKNDPFPVVPAAYLIAEAGLKRKSVGGAMVSDKHTNFIVNTGGATATDVISLIKIIKSEVLQRFGVELEEEIRILI